MKYSRELIIQKIKAGEKVKFLLFWGHTPRYFGSIDNSCLSQWYDCVFTEDGREYHTAEQYMLAKKALLFGDNEVYEKIMGESHPNKYKKLGRQIRGFDENVWKQHRTEIVTAGNVAKFSCNEPLKSFLLETAKTERVLVEASPYDKIWGIGMSKDSPDAENPEKWNGINLLGFCLMEARDILLGDEK